MCGSSQYPLCLCCMNISSIWCSRDQVAGLSLADKQGGEYVQCTHRRVAICHNDYQYWDCNAVCKYGTPDVFEKYWIAMSEYWRRLLLNTLNFSIVFELAKLLSTCPSRIQTRYELYKYLYYKGSSTSDAVYIRCGPNISSCKRSLSHTHSNKAHQDTTWRQPSSSGFALFKKRFQYLA